MSTDEEFDRIVAGLDVDPTAAERLDAAAAKAAKAAEERKETETAPESDFDDDLSYRDVGPVDLPEQDRLIAWAFLVAGPAILIGAELASKRLSPVFVGFLLLGCAGALVYLILARPASQSASDDQTEDGTAL